LRRLRRRLRSRAAMAVRQHHRPTAGPAEQRSFFSPD